METASKQFGKLLFKEKEIILTSKYTIIGRSEDTTNNKDHKEFLSKLNVKDDEVSRAKLGESKKLSKSAILIKITDNKNIRNIEAYNLSKNIIMIDDILLSKHQSFNLRHQSFVMIGPYNFFFILPKTNVQQLSKERIEMNNLTFSKQAHNDNSIPSSANQEISKINNRKNLINLKKQRKFLQSLKIKRLEKKTDSNNTRNINANILSSLNLLPELKAGLMNKVNKNFVITISKHAINYLNGCNNSNSIGSISGVSKELSSSNLSAKTELINKSKLSSNNSTSTNNTSNKEENTNISNQNKIEINNVNGGLHKYPSSCSNQSNDINMNINSDYGYENSVSNEKGNGVTNGIITNRNGIENGVSSNSSQFQIPIINSQASVAYNKKK